MIIKTHTHTIVAISIVIAILALGFNARSNTSAQTPLPPPVTGCAQPTCSTKDIGNFNNTGTILNPETDLLLAQEYWVSIKIDGRSQGTSGGGKNDTIIALDVSTSMNDPIPINSSSATTTTREEAAKLAAKRFVELSDPLTDNLGFVHFPGCRVQNAASGIPTWWTYDRDNPYTSASNKVLSMAKIVHPLQTVTIKQPWYDMIDRFDYHIVNVPTPHLVSTSCLDHSGGVTTPGIYNGNTYVGGGTSMGAGLSASITLFTDTLSSQLAVRNNGTQLRNAAYSATSNNGPVSPATNLKHVILISDGQEGSYPLVHDLEIDRSGTILQKAKTTGVRVHNVVVGAQSPSEITYVQDISSQTGGRFFNAVTQDELIASLESISSTVASQTGTLSTVQLSERINQDYFEIIPLSLGSTFRIQRVAQDGSLSYIQNSTCAGLSCVTNLVYAGSELRGFDMTTDQIPSSESRIIYFKIRSKNNSNPNYIPLNDTSTTDGTDASTINYLDFGLSEIVDNKNVRIGPFAAQYFQINNGNIYSDGRNDPLSISTKLPFSNSMFNTGDASIIQSVKDNDFGNGEANQPNYTIRAENTYLFNYQNAKKSAINASTSNNVPPVESLPEGTHSILIPNDARINDIRPDKSNNKKLILLVEGDVYIEGDIEIPANARSGLIIYAKGNVGIEPQVSRVDAVIITEGLIDTRCEASRGFDPANDCSTVSTTNIPLELQGSFVANKGFSLERSAASVQPAELFIYRPDMLIATTQSLGKTQSIWSELSQ